MLKNITLVMALLAGIASAAPARAALTANALTANALAATGAALDQLDGVRVEAVTLPDTAQRDPGGE